MSLKFQKNHSDRNHRKNNYQLHTSPHQRLPDRNRKHMPGWAWWLMPVIQALWKPRWADHLRSGVQDQPDQRGETPSFKII